jgi:hypothetical protein
VKGIFPLLLLAGVLGCDRPQSDSFKVAPSVFTVPPPDTGHDAWPARAEVLKYLEGKEMPLNLPAQPGESVTIRKDQIEALTVETGGRMADVPGRWRTPINFVVNTTAGRYAVNAAVVHQLNEGERVFFRLEFTTVIKR